MTDRVAHYTTHEERTALVAEAEAAGETMRHDEFAVGPEGQHRLTFHVAPIEPSDPAVVRLKITGAAITDGTAGLAEVVEFLRLQFRL